MQRPAEVRPFGCGPAFEAGPFARPGALDVSSDAVEGRGHEAVERVPGAGGLADADSVADNHACQGCRLDPCRGRQWEGVGANRHPVVAQESGRPCFDAHPHDADARQQHTRLIGGGDVVPRFEYSEHPRRRLSGQRRRQRRDPALGQLRGRLAGFRLGRALLQCLARDGPQPRVRRRDRQQRIPALAHRGAEERLALQRAQHVVARPDGLSVTDAREEHIHAALFDQPGGLRVDQQHRGGEQAISGSG